MIRVLWILLFVASSVLWARDIDESASSSTEDVSSSSGPQELDVQISKSGFRTYTFEPQVTGLCRARLYFFPKTAFLLRKWPKGSAGPDCTAVNLLRRSGRAG